MNTDDAKDKIAQHSTPVTKEGETLAKKFGEWVQENRHRIEIEADRTHSTNELFEIFRQLPSTPAAGQEEKKLSCNCCGAVISAKGHCLCDTK